MIPDGLHDIPPGRLATLVTSLEMTAPPPLRPAPAGDWSLERWERPDADAYLDLWRAVGADWLWFSRLEMDREALSAILASPDVEVWRLTGAGGEGLLELDFRAPGECELAFFGLTAGLVGSGAGRWMMNHAIARAWSRPIARLWVHTCGFDHPAALDFYRRSGFRPVGRQVEVFADPRLAGLLPRTAAPQVPLAE